MTFRDLPPLTASYYRREDGGMTTFLTQFIHGNEASRELSRGRVRHLDRSDGGADRQTVQWKADLLTGSSVRHLEGVRKYPNCGIDALHLLEVGWITLVERLLQRLRPLERLNGRGTTDVQHPALVLRLRQHHHSD